jgi:hypothetical protein
MAATRELAAAVAQRGLEHLQGAAVLPPKWSIVVVVTDESGEWVGVARNASPFGPRDILHAALNGSDYREHPLLVEQPR